MKRTVRALRDAGEHARFVPYKADPNEVTPLSDDHPAVIEGRSLFPSRVAPPTGPRMLISGHNSPKTGRIVTLGAWEALPIFTLTLEERATCPRSCDQWRTCFGSGMPWPNRWDARHPDFMDNLRAEIIMKAREHPKGFVVRLHVLGDFFSVPYIRLWADMIDRFPNLKVFGYTHRREDADDEESRKIALAIRYMTENAWDQFAIRFSHPEAGPQRAVVYMQKPDDPNVIMCPQQTDKTASCGTCGLCWAPAAKNKTIGFLKHGNSYVGRPKKEPEPPKPSRAARKTFQRAADRPPQELGTSIKIQEKRPFLRPPAECQSPGGCSLPVFKRSYCETHYRAYYMPTKTTANELIRSARRFS